MKKITGVLYLLAMLVFVSCSSERPQGGEYINILSRIARSEGRLSGLGFESGDAIGVYVARYAEDGTPPAGIAGDDYAVNLEHVYRGGTWERPGGGQVPWPAGRKIDIYAYYPYSSDIADPTRYLFTVKPDQNAEDDYYASDLLWSNNLDVGRQSDVPLTFYHRMSRINLNIHSSDAAGQLTHETRVVVKNVAPAAYLNIETGAVSAAGAGAADILPYVSTVSLPGHDLSATAITAPQNIPAGTSLIHITHREFTYEYVTDSDIAFVSGTSVTFDITLTSQGIQVAVTGVDDWGEGPVYGGNIGQRVPRVADITSIDWDESYVHYIYDNSVLIGQVCREYLFRNGTSTNFPAIVVYPIGVGGAMDLTRGYVAQVYNRNRNSATNQYEVNPATVHGGIVEFGLKDTLYTYTAGSLAPVGKVGIDSADDIYPAADNAIATLDIRPYLMTDADGTSYPVVKIGTQYWMQENLKTESYADGTPLTVYYFNDDRTANRNVLGGLYTWYDLTRSPGVAPGGWRVPTNDDWYSIYHYLYPNAGMKMRALEMWANISNADNVSGFSGLPAGRRTDSGAYNERNSYGQWWSSYSATTSEGWRIYLSSGGASIGTGNLNKYYTQSVRLLRDN